MGSVQHRRQLDAILSIDMTQYSWFMSLDESSTHEIAKSSLRRFEKLLKKYGGQSISGQSGDGMIARLDSAVDAVALATSFQTQMSEDPLPVSDGDIARFRIGIHVADVIHEDGFVTGTGVNIAKRLEGLADPGGILLSSAAYDHLDDKKNYNTEYIGHCKLKNIPVAVEAHRLLPENANIMMRPVFRDNVVNLKNTNSPSIAVLPFRDLSIDQDEGYFCSGLTEEIISNLSKFRELFVISHNSSVLMKDREISIPEIGKGLGVEYILVGSVNRSNTRMRVVTQLMETEYGNQIWADKFDRNVEDVFDFQDEVTQLIAVRLADRVEGMELSRTKVSGETEDLEAYGLTLMAQENFYAYTRQGNHTAQRLYEKAIERDPKYARAYAALSRTHIYDWRYLWTDTPEVSFETALETARLAVKLDEGDARGYAELAFVHLWSKQVDAAIGLFERALILNPNSADIMAEFADALAYAGKLEQAEAMLKKAMRLNPFHPDWYLWYLADIYFCMARYSDVVVAIEQMRDQSEGHRLLAAAYAMMGKTDKARYFADKVIERQPNFSVSHWADIQPDMDPAIKPLFIQGLLRAGLPE
ncbi:MAG: tetratricopeptide repeat protein [Anderseniella sp.]